MFEATGTGSSTDSGTRVLSVMESQHVDQEGVRQTGHLDDALLLDMAERGMMCTPMA
jgi:hypothetical protein